MNLKNEKFDSISVVVHILSGPIRFGVLFELRRKCTLVDTPDKIYFYLKNSTLFSNFYIKDENL